MHPILFKIPLPSFNLPYAWIPLIVAALAVLPAYYDLDTGVVRWLGPTPAASD